MRYSELMTAFSDVLLKGFRDLLKQVFQDAEEQLLKLAESTEDRFFIRHAGDVIRSLRLEEFSIQLFFCRELKSNFEAFLRHDPLPSEAQIAQPVGEFAWSLNQPMATAMPVDPNRGKSFDSRMRGLTDRLQYFSPYAGLVQFRSELPIAPTPVVHAFCRALESLDLPIHKKIMATLAYLLRSKLNAYADEIYERFDQELVRLIEPVPTGIQETEFMAWPATTTVPTGLTPVQCRPWFSNTVHQLRRNVGTWMYRMGDVVSPEPKAAATSLAWQNPAGQKSGADHIKQPVRHCLSDDKQRSKWRGQAALIALVGLAFMVSRHPGWTPILPFPNMLGDPVTQGESEADLGSKREDAPKSSIEPSTMGEESRAELGIPAELGTRKPGSNLPGSEAQYQDDASGRRPEGARDPMAVPAVWNRADGGFRHIGGTSVSLATGHAESPLPLSSPDLASLKLESNSVPEAPSESPNRDEILKNIRIKGFDWNKLRPDNAIVMNLRIQNGSPVDVDDLQLICTSYSENLTDLGILQIRLPQAIPSGAIVLLKDLNLGSAHRKTKRLHCTLS